MNWLERLAYSESDSVWMFWPSLLAALLLLVLQKENGDWRL